MKINPGFILKTVSGKHVIIPTGTASLHFQGMITVNETGKLLFEALQKAEVSELELIQLLTDRYEVSELEAKKDVQSFLDILKSKNIIE